MAFDDAQGYIAAVEPQMAQVHKHAAAMVRREGELATAYRDFGLAATRLAQAEEGGYGRALAQLGHTADRASSLMQEQVRMQPHTHSHTHTHSFSGQANTEALVFEEPLQDYVRTTGAVKAALQKRAGKHLTYRTVTGELQGKQAAAARAREQGRTDRYQAAEEEVRVVSAVRPSGGGRQGSPVPCGAAHACVLAPSPRPRRRCRPASRTWRWCTAA